MTNQNQPPQGGQNSHLTHFDHAGASKMVDVGDKPVSERRAKASGSVRMAPETLQRILNKSFAKGDVLEVARLAGIQAAKRTWELIPLCHMLPLDGVTVQFTPCPPDTLEIAAEVRCSAKTGVEMEAMVAVSMAALTIYDMAKAIDRVMVIDQIRLEEKSGGRSGEFRRS
jgi:cyclic pyranopterin phosphate synthase